MSSKLEKFFGMLCSTDLNLVQRICSSVQCHITLLSERGKAVKCSMKTLLFPCQAHLCMVFSDLALMNILLYYGHYSWYDAILEEMSPDKNTITSDEKKFQ